MNHSMNTIRYIGIFSLFFGGLFLSCILFSYLSPYGRNWGWDTLVVGGSLVTMFLLCFAVAKLKGESFFRAFGEYQFEREATSWKDDVQKIAHTGEGITFAFAIVAFSSWAFDILYWGDEEHDARLFLQVSLGMFLAYFLLGLFTRPLQKAGAELQNEV